MNVSGRLAPILVALIKINMNSKVKNGLFLLFIFLFVIITGLTWLSASGYKFNLSWPIKWNRVLEKTGMLNLSTLPKGAYIYLDDRPQKNTGFSILKKDLLTTPIKIRNLLPGDYLLRLEKTNYWPLEKKVRIESGQTTFLEDINLFINDLPFFITGGAPGELIISPDNNYLYAQTSGMVIDLKNNQLLTAKLEENSSGVWLKDNNFFSEGKTIEVSKNNLLDLSKTIGSGATNWRYGNTNNKLYFINQNEISHLDSDYKTIKSVIKGEKYLDYEIRENNIFVITESNKISLKNYSLSNLILEGEIELPLMGKYELVLKNSKYIELFDRENKTLYLINPSNLQDIDLIKNISDWTWIREDEMIYTNGWEINTYNLVNSKSNLITRVGENISRVLYHKKGNYFIFATQTNLNVGDFQDGSYQSILNATEIGYPVLDEKNNLLYFYAKINDELGIYKLILQ